MSTPPAAAFEELSPAAPANPEVTAHRLFEDQHGISPRLLERVLAEALSTGGDYADLYFESVVSTSLAIDEGLVKTARESCSLGCGIRVLSGERTGYAYSDDLSPASLLHAARTAALIASAPARVTAADLRRPRLHSLYPQAGFSVDAGFTGKLELLRRADAAARAYDPRIRELRAGLNDELKHILIATSDGTLTADTQPLLRFNVGALARDGAVSASGSAGGGGRHTLDYFDGDRTPEYFAREAARTAILQLTAAPAPAGEMEVVLGPGWPGVLIHEAVGHGLEADFNRRKTSAFSGRIGQQVASEHVTVVDNGTLPGRRGSINVDDEGLPTQNTTLIERGILRTYMADKLNGRLLGMGSTGSGRRESFHHIPMPRMTNTYMLAGQDAPEDILRSVRRGLYAVNFGGGSVDITSGKFVFSASEAYLIEDGKVGRPVRGATLIGSGPEALKYVSMVGHDQDLDQGIGTCMKQGQGVPVGVGMPTAKLDRMVVGGTGA